MSRHDLYVVGLRAQEKRISDWRERDITPKWTDRWIVGLALLAIVVAMVWRP